MSNIYFKLVKLCVIGSIIFSLPLTAFASNETNPSIRLFYESSKSGKVIDFVGDSTTESAPAMFKRFLEQYAVTGGALQGVTINNRGASGNTLHNFVNDNTANGNSLGKVIKDNADLYIISYGINDIRRSSTTGASGPTQIKADLKTTIDRLLKETKGSILLRTPNTFLSRNPVDSVLVSPIENAQLYSDQLWGIYESFKDYSDRVDVIDIPSLVFGRKAMPEHILMQDILHPNDAGYQAIADAIADRITGGTAAGEWHYMAYDPKTFTIELRQATPIYDDWQQLNHKPVSYVEPQILTVLKEKIDEGNAAGTWYQVQTWLGEKWIHAVRPIVRYTEWVHNIHPVNNKQTTVKVMNGTLLYKDAYTDTSTGYSINPQSVEVIDVGNYMYKIKTWYGDLWIPSSATNTLLDNHYGKFAGSNKVVPVDQVINLTTTTALSELPTTLAAKSLGALSPQMVRAFEKKGDWYHIHTNWTGDAWLYYPIVTNMKL
ncbi:GDSL-type esterase/lipase family protein [Paenibacillus sp. 1_12]|uniref:SGNH/GDSL hydrolase family protein n=1 Tax=Paenibacillus sp. 1_12 TaxID=1566278 RepID=UPI0015A5E696|nr:GDSL-type esterase/lipase family protein [Paenibacillus sp. 1_12]